MSEKKNKSEETEETTQATTSEPAVEVATPPVADAELFVKQELAAARQTLRRVQIVGGVLVIILAAYLGAITINFYNYLQPVNAAEIASGFVAGQIDDNREAFLTEVETRVPAMIQQAPDMALEQIKSYREVVENKFEDGLSNYCQSVSGKLSDNLEDYIMTNKEQLKAVLELSDPKAMAAVGATLRAEVINYLKEEPAEGESIDAQIQESRSQLEEAEARLNHLATGKNLTAAEKKTRHAVAIIANTVEAEQLRPLRMPKLTLDE
ncbi:MAG: hypothetical protein ACYC7E_09610 [Armatimonadota bacterium]